MVMGPSSTLSRDLNLSRLNINLESRRRMKDTLVPVQWSRETFYPYEFWMKYFYNAYKLHFHETLFVVYHFDNLIYYYHY